MRSNRNFILKYQLQKINKGKKSISLPSAYVSLSSSSHFLLLATPGIAQKEDPTLGKQQTCEKKATLNKWGASGANL
jgi:hypothetical protein